MGVTPSSNFQEGNLPPDFPKDVLFFRLENLGNTCFCNCVLQAFLYSSSISVYIKHLIDLNLPKELSNTTLYHFINIFSKKIELTQMLERSNSNEDLGSKPSKISRVITICPREFIGSIYRQTNQFIRDEQNDAHEFLIYLISSFDDVIIRLQSIYDNDAISTPQTQIESKTEEDNNKKLVDNNNPSDELSDNNHSNKDHENEENQIIEKINIKQSRKIPLFSLLFEGTRLSSFECAHCHHVQEKIDKFTFLDIGIPSDNTNRELDLQKLIDAFLDPDKISAEEGGCICSGCNRKDANVDIYSYIKELPVTLIIQLQRFKFNKKTQIMEKISKYVKIQNKIHLNSGCGPQKYKLKTIICHRGNYLHQGHFIALHRIPRIKNKTDQNLKEKSDQSVEPSAPKEDYWIYASDSDIQQVTQSDIDALIQGKMPFTPYVMFYEIVN